MISSSFDTQEAWTISCVQVPPAKSVDLKDLAIAFCTSKKSFEGGKIRYSGPWTAQTFSSSYLASALLPSRDFTPSLIKSKASSMLTFQISGQSAPHLCVKSRLAEFDISQTLWSPSLSLVWRTIWDISSMSIRPTEAIAPSEFVTPSFFALS